jgi:hypothetical protein
MKKSLKLIVLLLIIGSLTALCSCKKDDIDYASVIAGSYSGTVTITGTGSAACTCTLERTGNTEVTFKAQMGSSSTPDLSGIDVSCDNNNVYTLTYSDNSGSLNGIVENNRLTWTIIAGSITENFSGTR